MSNPHLATEQLLELLLTLKQTTPAAAKSILNNQPAIAYALITLMVSMNAVNIEVFQNTLAEFGAANAAESSNASASRPGSTPSINPTVQSLPPPAAPAPVSAIPPHLQAQYRTSTPPSFPTSTSLPPPSALASSSSSQGAAHVPTPPYGYNGSNVQGNASGAYNNYGQQGYGYQQQQPHYQQGPYQQPPYQQQGGYSGYPSYGAHQQPPPQVTPAPAPAPTPTLPDTLAGISEEQKTLIMRVLAMTPEQINMLPPADRATYIQIRTTLGVPT